MKKKLLWAGGVLVVIVVIAFAAGPWVYANWIADDADPELALPSQTQSATVGVDGTWQVVPGPDTDAERTQAGYRVDEVLRGQDVTVNGRTTDVTGSFTVNGGTLADGTLTVDVASITTDDSSRDNRFRGSGIMDADTYPTATFTLTEPVDVSSVPDSGEPVTLTAPGTMTIKGQERPVTAQLDVARSGETVLVQGSVPVTWSDYGVSPPSLGFVEVADTGTVEFLVNLRQA